MLRNLRLYPWATGLEGLLFWQATWFLYFQETLSGAQAVLLYVVYDISSTLLEVPSGVMSDRLGRRATMISAAAAALAGAIVLSLAQSFAVFALGQALIGAAVAFASGTRNALLFESLEALGRGDEVETHELRAWRAYFVALAVSAVIGGAMALWAPVLPFIASIPVGLAALAVAINFAEPPAQTRPEAAHPQLAALGEAFRSPVLRWLFAFSVAGYAFSHVPFVFGQPFILVALDGIGAGQSAPLASGAVSFAMMAISVLVSLRAGAWRARLGLVPLLLTAFAIQVGLALVLGASGSVLAIAVLLLRMVPNALSAPFVVARVQPLLHGEARATYLSLQSLFGRLFLSATLWAAARVSGEGALESEALSRVLLGYGGLGLVILLGFAITVRRARVEP